MTKDGKLVKGLMKAFYWVVVPLFRNWKGCLYIRGYRYTEPTTKTKAPALQTIKMLWLSDRPDDGCGQALAGGSDISHTPVQPCLSLLSVFGTALLASSHFLAFLVLSYPCRFLITLSLKPRNTRKNHCLCHQITAHSLRSAMLERSCDAVCPGPCLLSLPGECRLLWLSIYD